MGRYNEEGANKEQKTAIETGMVVVNGKPASTTHVVQNGDVISHTLHRHEPPVTAVPITVISEDEDMIDRKSVV